MFYSFPQCGDMAGAASKNNLITSMDAAILNEIFTALLPRRCRKQHALEISLPLQYFIHEFLIHRKRSALCFRIFIDATFGISDPQKNASGSKGLLVWIERLL